MFWIELCRFFYTPSRCWDVSLCRWSFRPAISGVCSTASRPSYSYSYSALTTASLHSRYHTSLCQHPINSCIDDGIPALQVSHIFMSASHQQLHWRRHPCTPGITHLYVSIPSTAALTTASLHSRYHTSLCQHPINSCIDDGIPALQVSHIFMSASHQQLHWRRHPCTPGITHLYVSIPSTADQMNRSFISMCLASMKNPPADE